MTRLMLDTSTCVHAMRHATSHARERLEKTAPGEVAVSSIVAAELWVGAIKSAQARRNVEELRAFLSLTNVLDWPAAAAEILGHLRILLERRGTVIGVMDMLIGAHAIHEGAVLITDNVKEFARIPNLKIENWIRR